MLNVEKLQEQGKIALKTAGIQMSANGDCLHLRFDIRHH